tara:strand:+ start:215 stop:700 length:486 start_codon:yes stop_codon:yes gene_type:complete
MPNHTSNHLTICFNDRISRDTFRQIIQGKGIDGDNDFISDFDFNTIKPMPKYIYKGSLGTEERKKYGSDNWYDWSCENWGTKWNAYDVDVESHEDTTLYIDFCTAWSPPLPILEHLWEKKTHYRITDINCEYKDEGWMYEGVYDNGKDVCWEPKPEEEAVH